ncbi:MAG: hypothetical protein ABWZ25_11660 [Chitinophagaceae bacterium]
MQRLTILIISSIIFISCNSKPSDRDIEKKILMEYTCFEKARVDNLKILDTKDAEGISGNKGYEYVVSGEIVWPEGCNEFGNLAPGSKEPFADKHVFLIKTDEGKWQ